MYTTIVAGTDGSPSAGRALERAAELARLSGARMHVVSAYEPTPARVASSRPNPEASEWSIRSDFKADSALEEAAATLGADLEVETHSPKGDPADAIVEIARREGADLIVLGNRGMAGARRILGSVPNKVSHHAPCDVLIVHTT
jgi:nucleotide-binding universal stress UspA family protein